MWGRVGGGEQDQRGKDSPKPLNTLQGHLVEFLKSYLQTRVSWRKRNDFLHLVGTGNTSL